MVGLSVFAEVGFEVRREVEIGVGYRVGRGDGGVLIERKSGGQFGVIIPEMRSVSNPTPITVGLSDTVAIGK